MALKNAFDNLSTEAAIRKLANLLTFARDSQDRIRVTVDNNNANNSVYMGGSTTRMDAGYNPAFFSAAAWNIMDSRETQRISMRIAADAVRKNRWTY
mgnify:CR=1 FL=1